MPTSTWARSTSGLYLHVPDLLERHGAMVNVSSVHAHVGFDGHAGYDASKGGMTALTRELAVEFGPHVRVNAVLPGPIITGIWDDIDEAGRAESAAMTTLARNGEPEEVAAAIAFLASDDASYVSGIELAVDGGWSVTKHTRRPLELSRAADMAVTVADDELVSALRVQRPVAVRSPDLHRPPAARRAERQRAVAQREGAVVEGLRGAA